MTEKENKEVKEMNLFQKLEAITNEIGFVAKNLKVVTNARSGQGYQAVSEVDVLESVKPLEMKYGVFSYPFEREIVESDVIETEQNGYTKRQFYMRLKTIYRFVNVDNIEEYIDVITYGDGIDSGDKATGKAMTYADKYALMKTYKISTGEDPDKDASQKLVGKGKSKTQSRGELLERLVKAKRYFIDKNVDIRDANAIEWLKQEAKTKSVDESILTDFELSNLINAYGELARIVEQGKELPFKTDSDQVQKNEEKEPTLDDLIDSAESLVEGE